MMSIEMNVGRLVEVRFQSPLTHDELAGFVGSVRNRLSKASGTLLGCTDLRGISTLAPDLGDALIWMMRRDNPVLEKNAFLMVSNSAFRTQLDQMIAAGGAANRRLFAEEAGVLAWLDPGLGPEERARLRAFLGAPARARRPGAP